MAEFRDFYRILRCKIFASIVCILCTMSFAFGDSCTITYEGCPGNNNPAPPTSCTINMIDDRQYITFQTSVGCYNISSLNYDFDGWLCTPGTLEGSVFCEGEESCQVPTTLNVNGVTCYAMTHATNGCNLGGTVHRYMLGMPVGELEENNSALLEALYSTSGQNGGLYLQTPASEADLEGDLSQTNPVINTYVFTYGTTQPQDSFSLQVGAMCSNQSGPILLPSASTPTTDLNNNANNQYCWCQAQGVNFDGGQNFTLLPDNKWVLVSGPDIAEQSSNWNCQTTSCIAACWRVFNEWQSVLPAYAPSFFGSWTCEYPINYYPGNCKVGHATEYAYQGATGESFTDYSMQTDSYTFRSYDNMPNGGSLLAGIDGNNGSLDLLDNCVRATGIYYGATGSSPITEEGATTLYIDQQTDLYARCVWQRYSVVFYQCGGQNGFGDPVAAGVNPPGGYRYGDTVNLNPALPNNNFGGLYTNLADWVTDHDTNSVFVGWTTSANGDGPVYSVNDSYTFTTCPTNNNNQMIRDSTIVISGLAFYGVCREKHTIDYKCGSFNGVDISGNGPEHIYSDYANGADYYPSGYQGVNDSGITLANAGAAESYCANPENSHHTGWTCPSGNVSNSYTLLEMPDSDVECTAQWACDQGYHESGGQCVPDTYEISYKCGKFPDDAGNMVQLVNGQQLTHPYPIGYPDGYPAGYNNSGNGIALLTSSDAESACDNPPHSHFTNWTCDGVTINDNVLTSSMPSHDVTCIGHWACDTDYYESGGLCVPDTYKITYDCGDFHGDPVSGTEPTHVYSDYDSSATGYPAGYPTGYNNNINNISLVTNGMGSTYCGTLPGSHIIFTNWSCSGGGQTFSNGTSISSMPTGDVSCTANWDCDSANGWTYDSVNKECVQNSVTYTINYYPGNCDVYDDGKLITPNDSVCSQNGQVGSNTLVNTIDECLTGYTMQHPLYDPKQTRCCKFKGWSETEPEPGNACGGIYPTTQTVNLTPQHPSADVYAVCNCGIFTVTYNKGNCITPSSGSAGSDQSVSFEYPVCASGSLDYSLQSLNDLSGEGTNGMSFTNATAFKGWLTSSVNNNWCAGHTANDNALIKNEAGFDSAVSSIGTPSKVQDPNNDNYQVACGLSGQTLDLYGACCVDLTWDLAQGSWPTDSNNSDAVLQNQSMCDWGQSGNITPLYTPKRTGYTFNGWLVTDWDNPNANNNQSQGGN